MNACPKHDENMDLLLPDEYMHNSSSRVETDITPSLHTLYTSPTSEEATPREYKSKRRGKSSSVA